jgi:hypothetical protein
MSRLAALAGASVVAISIATSASADTIVATGVGFSDGSRVVSVASPPSGAISGPYNAGRFEIITDTGSIFAWCVDLYRTISFFTPPPPPTRTYTLGELVDGAITSPAPLTDAQIGRVGALAEAGDDALASAASAEERKTISAAYQAAIWQTIYTGSTFSSVHAETQALLTTLNGTVFAPDDSGTLYTEFGPDGRVKSQQLYGDDPDPVPTIPVPGALGLFGFALAGLVLAGRRKA